MQIKPKYKLIQLMFIDEKGNQKVEDFPNSEMIISGNYIIISTSEVFENEEPETVHESASFVFNLSKIKKFKTQYNVIKKSRN